MRIDEKYLTRLTEEQKKLVENAKSLDELLKLAKDSNHELTDEQLEGISGGSDIWDNFNDPETKTNAHGY